MTFLILYVLNIFVYLLCIVFCYIHKKKYMCFLYTSYKYVLFIRSSQSLQGYMYYTCVYIRVKFDSACFDLMCFFAGIIERKRTK